MPSSPAVPVTGHVQHDASVAFPPLLRARVATARLLPVLVLAASAAGAQPVLLDRSRVTAVARQMNLPVEVPFRRFTAEIAFNPARLDEARARIEIDVASFDAGNAEINEDVKGRQWFDTKTHPKATFVSSAVRAQGAGRYEARGTLTLKGRILEVAAPFTVRDEAGTTVYEGQLPIRRLQYNIGEGVWKDTDTLADEVLIKFRLVAVKPPPPAKKAPTRQSTGGRP
jgi:polyisoprenoid-binding protein YceI